MLDKINLQKIMLKEEYKQEVPPLKQKMGELQQRFKQAKVPVIVLFEGWGASGKGSLMSNVILTMDPRGFHVESTTPPTLEERRHPYLWRFWKKLPARGTMGVFDRGWYCLLYTSLRLQQGVIPFLKRPGLEVGVVQHLSGLLPFGKPPGVIAQASGVLRTHLIGAVRAV